MESRILKIFVLLGVPGVALGVFYLLLKQFGFEFSKIGSTASAFIAIIFLLIVGGITFFALHRWAPATVQRINGVDTQIAKRKNRDQNILSSIEMLKAKIYELSKINRQLLIEVASSPDGQYVSDLTSNEKLMLTRGEVVYRGKQLEIEGFLDIHIQTDQCFEISKQVFRLVNNDLGVLKSLLENRGR
jgi:hypothetical protein